MDNSNSNSNSSDTNIAVVPNELRYATWGDLSAWGIVRLDAGNKYTCKVCLPSGWQVRNGDHPHWKELLDNNGRNRADIYHCDGPTGTKALISLRRRFTTVVERTPEHQNPQMLRCRVMDGHESMYATEWVNVGSKSEDTKTMHYSSMQAYEEAERLAKSWLASNFPQWQNCLQYWDSEF